MLVNKEINSSLLYKLSCKKSIPLGWKNYSLKGPSDKNLRRINRNAPKLRLNLITSRIRGQRTVLGKSQSDASTHLPLFCFLFPLLWWANGEQSQGKGEGATVRFLGPPTEDTSWVGEKFAAKSNLKSRLLQIEWYVWGSNPYHEARSSP